MRYIIFIPLSFYSCSMELSEKQDAHKTIDDLYKLYESNEYMTCKIDAYICKQLPIIFENMDRLHIERTHRIQELSSEQDLFIQCFLNNNQYFYISATEQFFYYDGVHYQDFNEDDILHHVLTSITKDRNLMSWKQRTKINIMKRIKDNSLLTSIPESDTIQNVLDLLSPALFSSRVEAKYFLTILGDNILRKNTNLIHFINPKSKQFLLAFTNSCQVFLGVGLAQTFKHKYYEHAYQDCRLVKINECVQLETIWNPIVKQSALDIICVACHYSTRYNSSDNYLTEFSNEDAVMRSVFYIKDMQPNDLVNLFVTEYLDKNPTSPTPITWKNMQYLWKQFLDSKNLPSVIFMQTLKGLMIEKLKDNYREDADSFHGICSKFLPAIQKFLQFWNETMVADETEFDLEIEEIVILFRKWTLSFSLSTNNSGGTLQNLTDKQIRDLISYYFPVVELERDKYISKIRCILWDKQLDIQVALDNLKANLRAAAVTTNYSIYDAYSFYCKQANGQNVSKSYFEKYVMDNFSEYIVETKFLSSQWIMV